MINVTDTDRIRASRLADTLREASGFRVVVTAEDCLMICRDRRELNFYYYKICDWR